MAEVVTLGAVLPFLATIAAPESVMGYPGVREMAALLGFSGPDHLLLGVTLIFCATAVAAGLVRLLLSWATNKYAFALGHDLGVALYRRVLYQPYSFHISRNTSEIIAAVQKVQNVTSGTLLPVMQGLSAVIISSFILAALFLVDPLVSVGSLVGFGLLYFVVSLSTRQTLRMTGETIASAQTSRQQAIQEGLGGIRDVLLDSTQSIFVARFSRLDRQFREAQAISTFLGAAPRYVIEAVGMVLIAILAYFLSYRDSGGLAAVLPILGALALGAQRLLPLLQQIYSGWTRIVNSIAAVEDVLGMLEQPMPAASLARDVAPLPFAREIALRNVSFAYQCGGEPVLRNLDFVIPKGARVGIVGKTGSGKSTLVDLLMGLLDPTEGHIEIDGRRLDATTRRAWQAQIAHVPQAIYLADATITENIAFGVEPGAIEMSRVQHAARQAELEDFIELLPETYDTFVGERGIRLSGGQRQRIGIARALYREAEVIVFDEATSALDNETEATVMSSINRLAADYTLLIIAHRESTLSACDLIIAIGNGKSKIVPKEKIGIL
ncbi:MAG: ABC transporter ATP-binding protein [Pseudorhodoplanes sp.]